jgi:hypothetical protein
VRLNDISDRLLNAMLARTEPGHLARLGELATRYPAQTVEHRLIEMAVVAHGSTQQREGAG